MSILLPAVSTILDNQVVHVKRGRMNGLGFEPAFNSYFDFYLNSKYLEPPLLQLEDVAFHLFLRKNLNDRNPSWKMPTIRQMKKRFGIGQSKIQAMMIRLEKAHLLKKESGVGKGKDGQNVSNDYILSDPIATLEEFLIVAEQGVFGQILKAEWCTQNEYTACTQNEYTPVPEMGTPHAPETGTDQQTSFQQTSENKVWIEALEDLKFQIGEKTFNRFMDGARLLNIEDGIATIGTPQNYARDWIENRLSAKLKRSLGVAMVRCVVLTE